MTDHKRYFALILMACLMLCGALIFVSQKVQEEEAKLKQINEQIADSKEEHRALKAEWSYLTRPQYLSSITTAAGEAEED